MESHIEYRLRPGSHHVKGDIQAIGERIEAIKRRHPREGFPDGAAPVDSLVEDARNPDSPLHGEFEWEDSEAAREYRLIQARRLWACYEIVITTPSKAPMILNPANVSIFVAKKRHYVSITAGVAEQEHRDQLLSDALAQLTGLQNRIDCLNLATKTLGQIRARLDEIRSILESEAEEKPKPKKKPKAG